ncbi:MAG: hypothetical protein JXA37_11330 [Chloroflexia bacterium]|nr:hypothetical protein [Chloroflexia bacterium]
MVLPARRVYFFPFLLLYSTWLAYREIWLERYGRRFSNNQAYRTSGVPVPLLVLRQAMGQYSHLELDL